VSESAFIIPSDWDGETFECLEVQWPASESWRVMFRSLLYLLTRGRTWDRDTGLIVDAQAEAWAIYDRNFPLTFCADCGQQSEDDDAPPCPTCSGGSLVVIGDLEMGGVVTDVTLENGRLYVWFGKCCKVEVGAIDDLQTETTITDEEVEPPADEPVIDDIEWFACGKASHLVERLEDMGRAAWDNRSTPYNVRNAILAANPGFSVSMTDITALWINMIGLMAIEGVTDADIFNSEFLSDWKCFANQLLEDDGGTFSATEFALFQGYPTGWALFSESPDIEVIFDVWVAAFWALVCDILGRDRMGQLMLQKATEEGDCSDCGGEVPAEFDFDLTYDFLVDDQDWVQEDGDGWLVDVGWRGTNNWGGSGTFIRMKSDGVNAPVVGYLTRVEITYVHTLGSGVLNSKAMYQRINGSDGEAFILPAQIREDAAQGKHTWVGMQPYGIVNPADSMTLKFAFGEEENSGTRFELVKIRFCGFGDPPLGPPVV